MSTLVHSFLLFLCRKSQFCWRDLRFAVPLRLYISVSFLTLEIYSRLGQPYSGYVIDFARTKSNMFSVLPTDTSLRGGGLRIFPSPRAFIQGENYIRRLAPHFAWCESPSLYRRRARNFSELLHRERAVYDDLHSFRSQSPWRGSCAFLSPRAPWGELGI